MKTLKKKPMSREEHAAATRAGMERARAAGKRLGAPCVKADHEEIYALKQAGLTVRAIAARVGISFKTVTRILGVTPRPPGIDVWAPREFEYPLVIKRLAAQKAAGGVPQCKAICRWKGGDRCRRRATRGWEVCRAHGAKKTGFSYMDMTPEGRMEHSEKMKGNTLYVKHGAAAKRLLKPEEFEMYEAVKAAMREQYPDLDPAADEILLDQLAFYCSKYMMAVGGDADHYIKEHGRAVSRLLRELAVRRDVRTKPPEAAPISVQNLFLQIKAKVGGALSAGQTGQIGPVLDVEAEAVTMATEEEGESTENEEDDHGR